MTKTDTERATQEVTSPPQSTSPTRKESATLDREPAGGYTNTRFPPTSPEESVKTASNGKKPTETVKSDGLPQTATPASYVLSPLSPPKTSGSAGSSVNSTKNNQLLPILERNRIEPKGSDPHFSYSQLNMFNRCPQQYKYRYIDGIKTPPGLPMASGKAIHEAFEFNSKYKMRTEEDMPLSDILDAASTAHDREMQDVEDATKKAKGVDKDENAAITTLYRNRHAPAIEPIAVEYPFRVVLEDDEDGSDYLPVIGYIDSFSQLPDPRQGPTTGRNIIALEDYKRVKKGGRKRGQLEIDISPQLTLYDYVYNLSTGGLTTDVVGYRQLGYNGPRAQEPGPYVTAAYRDAAALTPEARENRWRRVLNQMKRAQRIIRSGEFMATDNPMTCSWCGYKDICQVKPEV